MEATFAKVISFWKNADQGASTTLVAATDPALNGKLDFFTTTMETDELFLEIKGLFLNDCQFAEPAPHAKVPASAERLWKLSEELVGEKFDLTA
jgi:hypothetical protein